MENKKRLIYAEDLFEPVDFTVLQMGGRGGGKTMAMYEQIFRKRVELAPTIDAVEVVRCKDCRYYETVEYWPDGTKTVCRLFKRQMLEDAFCSCGERKDND